MSDKPKVNWRIIIITVALGAMWVMNVVLSHAIGETKATVECMSRAVTEMTERADPVLDQAEALRREVIERHGDQAAAILDRMLRLADDAIQQAEHEFEEADPARGGQE